MEDRKIVFNIYQLREGREDLLFLNYERLLEKGEGVHPDNYELVYAAELQECRFGTKVEILDFLFMTFNINHPKNFRGHSLSVSDVVVLDIDGVRSASYVDDFGFKGVSLDFIRNLQEIVLMVADRYVEIHECDDGWDYSVFDEKYKLLDGGVYDSDELSLKEVWADLHEDIMETPRLRGSITAESTVEEVLDTESFYEAVLAVETEQILLADRERVLSLLREWGYDVRAVDMEKNTVLKHGVQFNQGAVCPVFYMEGFRAWPPVFIAEKMVELAEDKPPFDLTEVMSLEYLMGNVKIALQRASEMDLVKKSTEFPGIDAYLRVEKEGISFNLAPWHLQLFKVEEAMVWQQAEKNTFAETMAVELDEYLKVMFPWMELPEKQFSMILLTNEQVSYGASAILNKEKLKELAEERGCDGFIAIPSSINEWLLMPKDIPLSEVSQMVRLVNRDEVLPEDRLADRAFVVEVKK